MPNPYKSSTGKNSYDPRWFIWTMVFLVVVGISLTSFILLSDHGASEVSEIPRHLTKTQ